MMLYGLEIEFCPEVYEPAEDTFLLAENLAVEDGSDVLEIGTGTGILALLCAAKARRVLAVDVNNEAAKCAKLNAELNGIRNVEVLRGDFLGAIGEYIRFDLIIFNPPYLPEDDEVKVASPAWSGGVSGRDVIDEFLVQVKGHLREGGRILTVGSSLSDYEKTLRALEAMGLSARVLAKKRFFFEELAVLEAVLPPPTNPNLRFSRNLSLLSGPRPPRR